MQYVLFPVVLLFAVFVPLVSRTRKNPARVISFAAAVALVFLVVWWNFLFGPGPRFLEFNNYHAVFGGVLCVTSDPEEVLVDLEVPKDFWDLPRSDAWSGAIGLDHPVHEYLKDLSRLTILKHYLLNSSARSGILREISARLALVESHPRGNRVREEIDRNPVRRIFLVPWQYSRLSRLLLGVWPSIVWYVIVGSTLWVIFCGRFQQWTGMRTAILFLLLWVNTQFVVAVLGEGLINLHQHLIGARLGLDLLGVFLVADIVSSAFRALTVHRFGTSSMTPPNSFGP